PSSLTNVCVENFSPNLTAHIQPRDAGIIRCFKAHFLVKPYCCSRTLNHYDADITPTKIYDINQLEVMRLANLAWEDVFAETIANRWKKAGILPSDNSLTTANILANLADEAETALSETLQDLQSRGVLQKGNSLSVEALVDVPEEQVMEDATDEEIFEAVQNMRMCRQDMEINGGDDNQDEHSPEPKPTRKEALHVMGTLRRYLEDEEGSFERKMEVSLVSFGRETRLTHTKSLVSTSITDYLVSK
ncbi:hypothetical protein B0H17DRAFT_953421, partial [Mycena rosella]